LRVLSHFAKLFWSSTLTRGYGSKFSISAIMPPKRRSTTWVAPSLLCA
jgi:hypothetical protein